MADVSTSVRAASLLIKGAQLWEGELADVRIEQGRVASIGPAGALPMLADEVVDARGGVLIPGLIDHHMHLFATAAAKESLACGPPDINNEAELYRVLSERAHAAGWLRGIGFHDSVCMHLDRHWLDRACPDRPVRIQHRSGMLWVLNTRALTELGIDATQQLPSGIERSPEGDLTGRCYDLDGWLGARLGTARVSLHAVSAELARYGITAVTDTGARNGRSAWEALVAASRRGELAQRLLVMGNEELGQFAMACDERVAVGPLKIYLREAELPDLDALVERMRLAHASNRCVAVHCVTRTELVFTLAALREAGAIAGDRIEHAAVADDHALAEMAALGVIAVTQPHFIAERGVQYLRDVDPDDVPFLYRGRGFLRRGVTLAGGSDAPYGSFDPWAAMRAAVERTNGHGVVMGATERLEPAQALTLFGGTQRRPGGALQRLAAGQPADLCLLDVDRAHLCADFDARHVAMTLCGDRVLYRSPTLMTKRVR